MVKKRRVVGSQAAREAKEDRQITVLDDVSLARDRLRGALHTLLDPSDPSNNEEIQKQALKKKQEELQLQIKQEQQQARQEEKKAALAARRKQRRAEMSQVAYHNTYVMKLFDRSVDLAQFKEGTPLYPICRAWMANQPRNFSPKDRKRCLSPDTKPKEEPMDEDEQPTNGQADGMDAENSEEGDHESESDADLVKDTYKMPPPTPITMLRYPIQKPRCTPGFEFDFQNPDGPSRETLLKEHLTRWSKVRTEWIDTANANEDRYKKSGRILKAIYEKAQTAFE